MARDWQREPYRKLLRNPSPSFRMLEALSQGIGYVLMREADDDGFVPFAVDFEEGLKRLWRLFTVSPRQRPIVARCVKDLLDDGTIQHVGERLWVKNLREVNERRDGWSERGGRTNRKAAEQPPTDAEPTLGEPSTTREPPVSQPSTTREPTVDDTSTTREPTVDDTSTTHRQYTDAPSKHIQVLGIVQSDPPSRARSQVGREVGSKGGREVESEDSPQLREGVTRVVFGLVADSTRGIESTKVVETSNRIGIKLDALAPELVWSDLEAEITSWISHARSKATSARDAGEHWSTERLLNEIESKALQRIRYRPKDARDERERERKREREQERPTSSTRRNGTSDGSIDWAAVDANRPRRARGGS